MASTVFKFKQSMKKYRKVGLHFSNSAASISPLNIVINNVDVESYGEQLELSAMVPELEKKKNRTAELAATSGLALLCNKALFPIRVPIALAVPPPIARVLPPRNLIQTSWLTTGGNSWKDGEDVEENLKKLDFFCKEWDLVRAVTCMRELSLGGVDIDLQRYFILIEVCGDAKALVEAKVVHQHIVNYVRPLSISIFNKILTMYGKCGSMDDAYDTFNKMPERNFTSWDIMISWYAKNGLGEDAIDMFTEFKEAGLKPDGQMFLGVFDACGVVGDVGEGMLHFDSMSKIYGITPTMEHYASIVHMFGSACDLEGVLEFIEKMPVEPNVDVWKSLMNISRIQGNVELGERCAEIVELLDHSRLTIETKSGCLAIKDSGIIKRKVRKEGLLEAMEHVYRPGDSSHPEHEKIYALLWGLKETLKEIGYVPETSSVVHDITQEDKEEAIMSHSEKLASAYALLTSTPRSYMYLMKSYHLCVDCHNMFKLLSELFGRKIVLAVAIKEVHSKVGKPTIVKEKIKFHHFEGGACSCKDNWCQSKYDGGDLL